MSSSCAKAPSLAGCRQGPAAGVCPPRVPARLTCPHPLPARRRPATTSSLSVAAVPAAATPPSSSMWGGLAAGQAGFSSPATVKGSGRHRATVAASAAATVGGSGTLSYFTSDPKADILAGITVALALVPEALAFTFVAGVHPLVGLHGAILMCGVVSLLGGRPGMISGAAGATAVVTGSLVASHGPQYLFACMAMAGVLQIAFGAARLGKLIRLVPRAAMLGFVNGLAIVILSAQFEHFQTVNAAGQAVLLSGTPLAIMAGLTGLTIAIIAVLPRITKALPAPLAAIGIVTGLTHTLGLSTKTIGDMAAIKGTLPIFSIPNVPVGMESLSVIAPYAAAVAAVGLIETLLTQNLVDEMTQTRSSTSKESIAQGLGNVANGFFGGMGGCAMIGQTMINMNSGGRGRLSGLMCTSAIALFVVALSSQIEMIPLAALVGVMMKVVYDTFAWESLTMMRKIPKTDAFVLAAVTVTTVMTNLAVAVILGVIISALGFAYKQSNQIAAVRTVEEVNGVRSAVYSLQGPLFFGTVMDLKEDLDPSEESEKAVVLDFQRCKLCDQSGMEALDSISSRFSDAGISVTVRNLSGDCRVLLEKADDLVDVDVAGSNGSGRTL
mmetsp:Transcript_10941/g.30933  ORF Transcript_10941/g.30933 Transcript_10941/m.30933 type:complete len:611 (+) Transcript_10941:229-2061(+)